MKILLLDIETAPNLAYVWGMWKQNISMDKIVARGHVLCWSAKWYGEKRMHYASIHEGTAPQMLKGIHSLLDESDAVVHYNGRAFDIPTLNKEFVSHGMHPPAPYKQIDLLEVVRKQFAFPINKLDYVAQALKLGEKVRHPGFQLWVDCMAGKPAAWKLMKQYNHHDVVLLEKLYDRLKPWIHSHPNVGAFDDLECCPRCGTEGKLQARGYAVTADARYHRYQCGACGGWSRGTKRLSKSNQTLRSV